MEEVLANRMVKTHDSQGVAYSVGNRAERRYSTKVGKYFNRDRQYHKKGHNK